MGFSVTKSFECPVGAHRITGGTFASAGGSAGGDIKTGLHKVDQLWLQQKGSAVVASAPVVYKTFPVVDPVTIVTAANAEGYWLAIGN
jgi:hypothetical protein